MSFPVLWLLWRRHRLAICLCLMVPLLIGFLAGLIYPQMRPNRELLQALSFVRRFLSNRMGDPLSPASFFSLTLQHPLCLILYAILPSIPALGLLAGERGRGGLDLLLAAPLERRRLVATLLVFIMLLLPPLLLTTFLGAVCGGALSEELAGLKLGRYVLAGLNALGLTLFWAGMALLVSVHARDRTQANLLFAGAVVVAFLLDSAARLAPSVDWLSGWTPYGYFRPAEVVAGDGAWATRGAGLAALGVMLSIAAAELQHRRRSA